jgi:hypothetical protein
MWCDAMWFSKYNQRLQWSYLHVKVKALKLMQVFLRNFDTSLPKQTASHPERNVVLVTYYHWAVNAMFLVLIERCAAVI